MVKIKNVFGDEYKGRQGNAVYQKFYGRQVRRLWDGKKENKAPGQEEQKRRFKIGLAFWESLSREEREALREYLAVRGLTLTPQQWAVKVALSRPRVVVQSEEVLATLVEWVEGWHAEGWPYRQKVDITSTLAQDLEDFQVKLELNANNVGSHFRWDLQGRDLRFYDDKGTKIPYWIESWDEQNKSAVVWIKVPLIQQNAGADIYMYYGNPSAASESDAESVFDFFDDFEGDSLNSNIWMTKGSISTSVADSILTVRGTSSSSWGLLSTTSRFSREGEGRVFDMKVKVNSDGAYYNVGVDDRLADGSGMGSGTDRAVMENEGSKVWRTQRENSYTDYPRSIDPAEWGILTIKWASSYVDFLWNYVRDAHATSNVPQDDMALKFEIKGSGRTVYVDWVRVRKYAEQEPAAEFGAEEQGKVVTHEVMTVTVKAIEHVAIADVRVFDEDGNEVWRAEGLTNIMEGKVTSRVRLPDEVTEKGVRALVRSAAGTVDIVHL